MKRKKVQREDVLHEDESTTSMEYIDIVMKMGWKPNNTQIKRAGQNEEDEQYEGGVGRQSMYFDGEAKKKGKNEAPAVDEDKYQNYFTNPQLRKEFDRYRLQQQMSEIQNLETFTIGKLQNKQREAFPYYPAAEVLAGEKLHQKNYATHSLCCLSTTNPLRSFLIEYVAINPWFDKFILFVIIVNSFFLAADREIEVFTEHTFIIDMVFLIIYTCEMLLKIIAMGFFAKPFTYLRDPWNVLDFFVVIMGWVGVFLVDQKYSAVRVVRILRPLRTINSMPGMSGLVATILNSLPAMANVLVLFVFMLIMFGTITTQLLGGKLEDKCYALNIDDPPQLSVSIGPEAAEFFCQRTNHAQVDYSSQQTNAYNYIVGGDDCRGKIYQHFVKLGIQDEPERIQTMNSAFCEEHGNPEDGTVSFDNLFLSIFNIFQIITLEGWTSYMYLVRDAEGSYIFDFLFYLIVLFGAYFVLNLVIAVQFTYLGQAFDEEDRRKKILKEKLQEREKQRKEQMMMNKEIKEEDSSDEEKDTHENHNDDDEVSVESDDDPNNTRWYCSFKKGRKLYEWSNYIEDIVDHDKFRLFIIFIIIINTIFLASEHYGQPDWWTQVLKYGNYVFTILFTVEMVFKLFGFGIKGYVQDYFNVFDGIIVIMSIVELFFQKGKGLQVLRAFRITRIFRIIKSWKKLRILIQTVVKSLSSISNLGILTLLFMFIAALLAKQFFTDPRDFDEVSDYNFNNTGQSFVTVFIVLSGENWNEIMREVVVRVSWYSVIFFVSIMLFGNYILLNLFLAILLKFISDNEEMDDKPDNENDNDQPLERQDQIHDHEIEGDQTQHANHSIHQSSQEEYSNSDDDSTEQYQYSSSQKQQSSRLNQGSQEQFQPEGGEAYDSKGSSHHHHHSHHAGGDSQHLTINQSNSDQEDDEVRIGEMKQQNNGLELTNSAVKTFAKRRSLIKQGYNKHTDISESGKSLYIFRRDSMIRLFLKGFTENPYFEEFIFLMIALNCLLLTIETPTIQDQYQIDSLRLMLNIISGIFVAECVFKVIVMGFVIGPQAYLKCNWNRLDFLIVACTIVIWVLPVFFDSEQIENISIIRALRSLRALRPLRVANKNEGIKTLVNSLILSVPSLLSVMAIIMLLLLVFGILGVQIWKGCIQVCNNPAPNITTKTECLAAGVFDNPVIDEVGRVTHYEATVSEWTTTSDINNYNNVINSMITFFEISTLEGWPDLLFEATSIQGIHQVLKRNNQPFNAIVFIVYIFLSTFFIFNLFISVIVDKFNDEIKKRQGADNFSDEQKEWVKIQRLLLYTSPKFKPIVPLNWFRFQCFKIARSKKFDLAIMLAILINTIVLCIDNHHATQELSEFLKNANLIFVIIFSFEMMIKITALGFKYYWHDHWNKFDSIIVIMSLFFINEDLIKSSSSGSVTTLRIMRIARLLRMVKTSQGIRGLLKTLFLSLGSLMTTAALLLLILFTYAVAGMTLFGKIEYEDSGDFMNKHANFTTFYLSMSTLWRCCTGESWNGIYHDCYQARGALATGYWLSFMLVTFFIFMNVFIAVIYENFNDIQASEDENDILSLKKKDIKAFQHTWAHFCPGGDVYMPTIKFTDFIRQLPAPLGFQGINIEAQKLNSVILCLNIKDHQGKVYYPEVMWAIFHSVVGINDEKINKCEQVITTLKILKKKYRDLNQKASLDSLCGNKFYKNEVTVIKYLMALKILRQMQKFKAIQDEQRALGNKPERSSDLKLSSYRSYQEDEGISAEDFFKDKQKKRKSSKYSK